MKNFIMASIAAVRPWVTATCGSCSGWGSLLDHRTGELKTCGTCDGKG